MIGAGQPFGVSKKLSYTMTADRYTGRVLYLTFRTGADLSAWLPPPLETPDPHAGFIKLYELKRRPEHGPPLPPSFSQYHEACVTVLAAPPGEVPRHYNLFMWVDRDWATYKARETLGWPKKLADIDITRTYRSDHRYDSDEGTSTFSASVVRHGFPIIQVAAELDPDLEPQQMPPFNGFYTVRHLPAAVGGEGLSELLVIETRDGWFGPGTYGTGEVAMYDAPDEELGLLSPIEVTGVMLRDVGWVLPGRPARRALVLPEWPIDEGSEQPEQETII